MLHHTIAPVIGIDSSIVRITSNGSISLPAVIRRRWGVGRVAVIDRGDLALIIAVPDDAVTHFRGRFNSPGPTSDQLRALELEAEVGSELAKAARVSQ